MEIKEQGCFFIGFAFDDALCLWLVGLSDCLLCRYAIMDVEWMCLVCLKSERFESQSSNPNKDVFLLQPVAGMSFSQKLRFRSSTWKLIFEVCKINKASARFLTIKYFVAKHTQHLELELRQRSSFS